MYHGLILGGVATAKMVISSSYLQNSYLGANNMPMVGKLQENFEELWCFYPISWLPKTTSTCDIIEIFLLIIVRIVFNDM